MRELTRPTLSQVLARRAVRLLDRFLAHRLGLIAYAEEASCLLRVSAGRAPVSRVLADGTVVHKGQALLELHLWNERLARQGPPDPAWGVAFVGRLRRSLRLLARWWLSQEEGGNSWPAQQDLIIHGEVGFVEDERYEQLGRTLGALGFEVVPGSLPRRNPFRAAWWASLLSWWLMAAYSPASRRSKTRRQLRRYHLWMSGSELLRRYGPRSPSSA